MIFDVEDVIFSWVENLNQKYWLPIEPTFLNIFFIPLELLQSIEFLLWIIISKLNKINIVQRRTLYAYKFLEEEGVSHFTVWISGRSRFEFSSSVFHNKCFVSGFYKEPYMVTYINVYNIGCSHCLHRAVGVWSWVSALERVLLFSCLDTCPEALFCLYTSTRWSLRHAHHQYASSCFWGWEWNFSLQRCQA